MNKPTAEINANDKDSHKLVVNSKWKFLSLIFFLIGLFLLTAGQYIGGRFQDLYLFAVNNPVMVIAISSLVLGTFLLIPTANKYMFKRIPIKNNIADVDERQHSKSLAGILLKQIDDFSSGKHYDKAIQEEMEKKLQKEIENKFNNTYKNFESYFDTIKQMLTEKSAAADEKASKLLDRGIAYSKNGIYFFFFAIVIWQFLLWGKELQPQHIYGMASCSLLFIFIELLSAWFLKQYMYYVNTSTYLIKI